MDAFDVDQAVERLTASLPAGSGPRLLAVLTAPDEERAQAIGEMYRAGRASQLLELLIDLEEDPIGEQVRAMVVASLRRAES